MASKMPGAITRHRIEEKLCIVVGVDELIRRCRLIDPRGGREIWRVLDKLLIVVAAIGQVRCGSAAEGDAGDSGCAKKKRPKLSAPTARITGRATFHRLPIRWNIQQMPMASMIIIWRKARCGLYSCAMVPLILVSIRITIPASPSSPIWRTMTGALRWNARSNAPRPASTLSSC